MYSTVPPVLAYLGRHPQHLRNGSSVSPFGISIPFNGIPRALDSARLSFSRAETTKKPLLRAMAKPLPPGRQEQLPGRPHDRLVFRQLPR